jgi:phosphoglycolate phosphatase-like HAD superfamily hydrolase
VLDPRQKSAVRKRIAAKHARVRAIGLLSGGFSRAELEASGCAAVYRDPADLLAHYEETVRLLA